MNGCFRHAIRASALLGLLATVWAAGATTVLADAGQGFSLGGGVGRYDIAINNASEFGNVIDNYSTNDTAYQFFANWRFAPYLALEGQYMNLGTDSSYLGRVAELRNHISGWAPWLVGTLPIGSINSPVVGPFELFVKGGEYFYQYHTDYVTPAGTFLTHSDTYDQFVWGGGLGLVFVRHLDVRLEYDVLKVQNTNRSNALWLTAAFNF